MTPTSVIFFPAGAVAEKGLRPSICTVTRSPGISSEHKSVFMEKMVVRRCIGVKISSGRVDNYLPQQASLGELMQCIVDCR